MVQHHQWLQQISSVVLKEVNVSIEDYIDTITTPGVPLDFVALMFLCRIYHIHVAVFTTRGVWSTCRNTKKDDCLFGVVYNGGNFAFTETVKEGKGDQYRRWLEDRAAKGRMPSHTRTDIPGLVKVEGMLCSLPDALSLVNNNVLCKHRPLTPDNEDSTENAKHLNEVKQKFGIPDFKTLLHLKKEQSFGVDVAPGIETEEDIIANLSCTVKPKDRTKNSDLAGQASSQFKTEDSTENSDLAAQASSQFKTEDSTKNSDLAAQASSQFKTEDSTENSDTETGSEEVIRCDETLPYSDTEISALWDDVSRTVQEAKVAVGETVQDIMLQDSLNAQDEIVIDDELLLVCPMCLKEETTQKACIKHIDTYHPEYRYPCRSCEKDFNSFHARYHHEMTHSTLKHVCGDCGKGFGYRSELQRHSNVHNEVLPFACSQCNKRFAQKKSLKRHEDIHTDTMYKCKDCDKICSTQDHLYSHQRGAHGKGYRSKCGKFTFQWPTGRARHQEVCNKCQAITAEEYKRKFVTTPKPAKKVKTDTETDTDSVQDLKEHIQFKIENIIRMKQGM